MSFSTVLSLTALLWSGQGQVGPTITVGILTARAEVGERLKKIGNEKEFREQAVKLGFDVSNKSPLLAVDKTLAQSATDAAVAVLAGLIKPDRSSVFRFADMDEGQKQAVRQVLRGSHLGADEKNAALVEAALVSPSFQLQISQGLTTFIDIDGKNTYFGSFDVLHPGEHPSFTTPGLRQLGPGEKPSAETEKKVIEMREQREELFGKPYQIYTSGPLLGTLQRAELSLKLTQRLKELVLDEEAKAKEAQMKIVRANNKAVYGREEGPRTADELSPELQESLRATLRGTTLETQPLSAIKFKRAHSYLTIGIGVLSVNGLPGVIGFQFNKEG